MLKAFFLGLLALDALDAARREDADQRRAALDVALAKTIRWLAKPPDEVAATRPRKLPALLDNLVGLSKGELVEVFDGTMSPHIWALVAMDGSGLKRLRLGSTCLSDKWQKFLLARAAWDKAQPVRAKLWPAVGPPLTKNQV